MTIIDNLLNLSVCSILLQLKFIVTNMRLASKTSIRTIKVLKKKKIQKSDKFFFYYCSFYTVFGAYYITLTCSTEPDYSTCGASHNIPRWLHHCFDPGDEVIDFGKAVRVFGIRTVFFQGKSRYALRLLVADKWSTRIPL